MRWSGRRTAKLLPCVLNPVGPTPLSLVVRRRSSEGSHLVMSASPFGYSTPEEAALSGFPPQHCRVVACDVNGNDAYVLLDTGTDEHPYLYGGTVSRETDGWHDRTSGNGIGWTRLSADDEIGVLSIWAEAPAGADAVRLRWKGEEREVPVRAGAYLATWWGVPAPA